MSKFITSADGTPPADDGALGFAPAWDAPAGVGAFVSTRSGGVSAAPYDSLNLGQHVGDEAAAVAENRRRLAALLPSEPAWLNQVHGVTVVAADKVGRAVPDADASVSRTPGVVCAIMTADCLPVLLADVDGTVVGAAHAGWRGLAGGVIEATVAAMGVPGDKLVAYLGPAIGPDAFEVGPEVRDAFVAHDAAADAAFTPIDDGKYLADIYALARLRLAALGVTRIAGGDACTVIERDRFFSYRRDKVTGRMASCVWLKP
ncbi:peptidoglycan editing factor PgeF [Crenobacter luteus]|uniref:peptidoglycan editing factor PgeF n=1 Tax=Crenobacter luteus TaxID=1452487 RepID=UPI0009ED5D2E|nr:peptidoglycan editing factor PgeF [Crenobacter luteus]